MEDSSTDTYDSAKPEPSGSLRTFGAVECMTLRNVEVQVMPLHRGVHPGLDGPMRLLETPDNQWFGYCEGQESSQFITDPQTISTLYMRYAKLLSQALTPEDTRGLLTRMRGAP
ncbi:Scr1 family TA system antitoxin-like transcriptional regulator [Streptomyces platensis]